MKQFSAFGALALFLLAHGPVQAAQSWGLPGEEVVRFEATVVDILCELTGDCSANCGGGDRQLGLLDDDGRLHLPIKNATALPGTVVELIGFCAKQGVAAGESLERYQAACRMMVSR